MKFKTHIRRNSAWMALAALLLFLSPGLSAQYPIVYSQPNYTGKSLTLDKPSYTVDDLRATVGNDAVLSIKVPAGYEVTLIEHNFSGKEVIATHDLADVRSIQSPAVSSIRVRNLAYPVVYNVTQFGGQSLVLTKTEYNIDELKATVGNDAIRSITVPEGYEVLLYENHTFGGKVVTATRDLADLASIQAPAVSSIKIVRKLGDVIECEGQSYMRTASGVVWQQIGGTWVPIGSGSKDLVCARRRLFSYPAAGAPYRYNGTPNSWTSANMLVAGEDLNGGTVMGGAHFLVAANNSHIFYMQENGDLGIWTMADPAQNTWSSRTAPQTNCTLMMQTDGNLVVYDQAGGVVWASHTHTSSDARYGEAQYKPVRLVLEDDGKLVLYSATGFKVWDNVKGKYPLN